MITLENIYIFLISLNQSDWPIVRDFLEFSNMMTRSHGHPHRVPEFPIISEIIFGLPNLQRRGSLKKLGEAEFGKRLNSIDFHATKIEFMKEMKSTLINGNPSHPENSEYYVLTMKYYEKVIMAPLNDNVSPIEWFRKVCAYHIRTATSIEMYSTNKILLDVSLLLRPYKGMEALKLSAHVPVMVGEADKLIARHNNLISLAVAAQDKAISTAEKMRGGPHRNLPDIEAISLIILGAGDAPRDIVKVEYVEKVWKATFPANAQFQTTHNPAVAFQEFMDKLERTLLRGPSQGLEYNRNYENFFRYVVFGPFQGGLRALFCFRILCMGYAIAESPIIFEIEAIKDNIENQLEPIMKMDQSQVNAPVIAKAAKSYIAELQELRKSTVA